jgi:outer membrane protein, heavy metal efflux system
MKFRSLLFCGMLLGLATAMPARGQTTPQSSQAASKEKTVSAEELVREALEANPEIQAKERRVEALRARAPQARTLPDPTVTVGWLGEAAPFDVTDNFPPSYRGFAASQEFPFPGKLKLRGKIADRESEAARWEYEAAKRKVAAQVKTAYYQYAYCVKALEIIQNNRALLDKLTKVAEARYKAGMGIQQDVLRGQMEVSRLLQRITILTEQRNAMTARLNTLLNRDPESALPEPEELRQSKLAYTLEELYRMARANDTGLQREQRMIEGDEDRVALSRKSYDPDFSVNFMYAQRPSLPDTKGLFVTLNIPIFYKSKQREAVKEATENLLSEQSMRANRQTTVNYEVKEQYLAAEQAEKLAVIFSQAIVPQSSQALESSELAYEAGNADFLTMLSNFLDVLDYQVNYYQEISDYDVALAQLEPLVGTELTQ